MKPEFRRLGPHDVELLLSTAPDVFDNPVNLDRARSFLVDPRNILIVAMEDGQVIGQIACVVHLHVDAPADLYIDNLGVTPDKQRRGIARELIRLAREAGRAYGISTTWLAVDPDNDVAQELYRRTGASGAPALMFSYEETTGPSDTDGG